MKFRGLVVTAAVACTVGWFGRSVYSDDPPAAPPASPPADASADSNAEWVEFARPGEEHARLKQLVGDWAVHGKFTGFDGKLEEGDSVASFTMILGDRYLRQEAVGSFLGTPFEGRGIIGYDKAMKKWISVWLDTMGTGMMVAEGEETVKGKSWTFKSSFMGPKGPVATKDVMTVVSDQELTWESYIGASDKPMMSLHYVRKK